MSTVKDLPKIDNTLKGELEKDHKLEHVEVTEKNVLPSAEDVAQEKTHQGLIQGVENFSPEKLKKVKTVEPASPADVIKTEMAHSKSKEEVEKFDKNKMQHVETQVKNPLPDKDAINAEKEHDQFKEGIEGFNKDNLSKTSTVEKNTLPTKEVIEQEKKA